MIITKTYEQNFIYAQICSFEGKGGVTEYHIMFSVTDPSLSFGEQRSLTATVNTYSFPVPPVSTTGERSFIPEIF